MATHIDPIWPVVIGKIQLRSLCHCIYPPTYIVLLILLSVTPCVVSHVGLSSRQSARQFHGVDLVLGYGLQGAWEGGLVMISARRDEDQRDGRSAGPGKRGSLSHGQDKKEYPLPESSTMISSTPGVTALFPIPSPSGLI